MHSTWVAGSIAADEEEGRGKMGDEIYWAMEKCRFLLMGRGILMVGILLEREIQNGKGMYIR